MASFASIVSSVLTRSAEPVVESQPSTSAATWADKAVTAAIEIPLATPTTLEEPGGGTEAPLMQDDDLTLYIFCFMTNSH